MSRSLEKFGLTPDEAKLYLHLLKVKAIYVREILKSPDFHGKWRSNLYKVVNNLSKKNFIIEEEKGGKKLIFPVPPKEAIEIGIKSQELHLKELRDAGSELSPSLEVEYQKPGIDLSAIPEKWRSFIESIKDSRWLIREPPQIKEIRGMGKEYSVEFDTLRHFGAHSAGVVINDFAYPEHKTEALPRLRKRLEENIEQALKNTEPHGFMRLKRFWFETTTISGEQIPGPLSIAQIVTKWNIPGTFRGSMATLELVEFPQTAISLWGADHRDFLQMLDLIAIKYQIQVPTTL